MLHSLRRSARTAAALAALALAPVAAVAEPACRDDTVWLRGDWGEARFRVEVADTPEARAQGLMFVEEMPRSEGMLFVYERPQRVSFWMKNTLIPLDMIFADRAGVVRRVHAEAVPGDTTPIPGGDGIFVVLEINGGLAERFGIAPGTELRHPSLGAQAAWPC
ncbi:DUF192 domain-containing protein [Rhodosalinus sediminis]|uniref:DUF192 domain-containing protein n=1 Tax=Rhodosalinus sediminis TaxID=1940533 RepID=UPI0023522173|nr:DUF192 domain-containing protein [Rhodosalinus sediminis]